MTELMPAISDTFERKLPESVRSQENDNFILLLKKYYEWSEQNDQPTDFILNLMKYRDIDLTSNKFRDHLIHSLMDAIPSYSKVSRELLAKNVTEFLRSKGSLESFEIVMRAIYGEEIEMNFNSNFLFRASDNEFNRDASIVIETQDQWTDFNSSELIQTHPTPAKANIIKGVQTVFGSKLLNWIELEPKSIIGKFVPGGKVECIHASIDNSWTRITTYYKPYTLSNNVIQLLVETEEKRPYDNLIIKQLNNPTFRAVISSLHSRYIETGAIRIKLNLSSVVGTMTPSVFVNGKVQSYQPIYIIPSSIENSIIIDTDIERGLVSNSIVDVDIKNAGNSYKVGDKVKFIGGSGTDADGYVADVLSGSVDEVTITKKGFGYAVGDPLTVVNGDTQGQNAQFEVSKIDGIDGNISATTELNAIGITSSGSGYKVNDIITISDGTTVKGTPPATFQVTAVNSSWLFKNVLVNNAGFNYPKYTKIQLIETTTLVPIVGFAATPIFNSNNGIAQIEVTNIPVISTSNLKVIANGYGATASCTVSAGAITSISVIVAGVNYINPIIRIHGDGHGALATASVSGGSISTITLVKGGTGYTSATITIAEKFGDGFIGTPLFNNATALSGSISAVSILTRGEYTELPKCFNSAEFTTSGTGVNATFNYDFRLLNATVTNSGHYYHNVTTSISGRGEGAILKPAISNGVISNFNIVDGGAGYNQTDAIVLISGGYGFVGKTVVVDGVITSIVIINGGAGYSSSSIVSVLGECTTSATIDLTGVGNISNGVLTSITVLNGGKNYYHSTTISAPVTQLGAIAAVVTPTIVNGSIKAISTVGGSGYVNADLNNITINSGTIASITGAASGTGGIIGVTPINAGRGYFSQAEVTPLTITTSGPGYNAKFIPTLNSVGGFSSVDIIDSGRNYNINTSSIVVTGGGGSGAILTPVIYLGRIVDVKITNAGYGYKYGTYCIITGNGEGGIVTPIVETGITSAEVINGGSNYSELTTVLVTDGELGDGPGLGAVITPVIKNGVITSLKIVNKGIGYLNPILQFSEDGTGTGTGAVAKAVALRQVTDITITNKGSGYTYADVLVIGDGTDADFNLKFDKLGSIDSAVVTTQGTGIVETPIVTITDNSGYGSVSKVKIVNQGGGYKSTPLIYLQDKFNVLTGEIIATGANFICSGKTIGGVGKVMFKNHGGAYEDPPTPIFRLNATLVENSNFKKGETVLIKNGVYKEANTSTIVLLENGDKLKVDDDSNVIKFISQDLDDKSFDTGSSAKVINFDYDKHLIELDSEYDIFDIVTENDINLTNETNIDIVHQWSSSIDVGDILLGQNSGAHAAIKYLNRANGNSIQGGNGWYAYEYQSETGKLNSALSIIANNQRYQDYSYVIKTGIALKDYSDMLKKTVHPAGFSMFGDVVITSVADMNILNEIGYNKIIATVYIISLAIQTPHYADYVTRDDIYGDYSKFHIRSNNLSIQAIKDLNIRQTSAKVYMTSNAYTVPRTSTVIATANQIVFNTPSYVPNIKQLTVIKNDVELISGHHFIETSTSSCNMSSAAVEGDVFKFIVKNMSIAPEKISEWNIQNGARVTMNSSISPNGSMTSHLIGDTSDFVTSGIYYDITCIPGDTIAFSLYIHKQVNPTTFCQLSLGSSYININTETGEYITNDTSLISQHIDLSDFWFIEIQIVAMSATVTAKILPSVGFIEQFYNNVLSNVAISHIDVFNVQVKNVTNVGKLLTFINSINSQYVPWEYYISDIESDITVTV